MGERSSDPSESGTPATEDSAGFGFGDEPAPEAERGGPGVDDPAAATPLTMESPTDHRAQQLMLGQRGQEVELVEDGPFTVERRYWLNCPYAYAVILHNEETGEHEYRLLEPWLDNSQAALYRTLSEDKLIDRLRYRVSSRRNVDRNAVLEEEARDILAQLPGFDVTESEFARVLYYLKRDMIGYEKIDALMRDPHLEEITCNGADSPIYVDHRDYEWIETNIVYRESQLKSFVRKLAQRSGKDISTASPIQETSLPDGERVTLALGNVAPRGPNFSIRKYSDTPFTPIHLVRFGTFSVEQMAYLWELIEQGESGLIIGGTNSGKTTTLNALSMFLPPKHKVVSIEDTRELTLPHENWTANLTREGYSDGDAEITMFDLLTTALRQSPDYLLVGEVRGEEARSMFQAMNTGHTTYSTLHADSVQTALSRLENEPMVVERNLIRELGFISIQSRYTIDPAAVEDPDEPIDLEETDTEPEPVDGDGDGDGENDEQTQVRRNTGIVEILGMQDTSDLNHRRVFDWDPETDTHSQSARSHHVDDRTSHLEERLELLEHLVDEGITSYEYVSTVLRAFMTDRERVLEQVRSGTLDFSQLEAIEGGYAPD